MKRQLLEEARVSYMVPRAHTTINAQAGDAATAVHGQSLVMLSDRASAKLGTMMLMVLK